MLERKDIDNLANLARIALSDGEKDKLQQDMEAILGYVGELQKAPSFAEASPLRQGFEGHAQGKPSNHYLRNVMREDIEPFDAGINTENILSQAPKRRGDYFVVKKILGDSIS